MKRNYKDARLDPKEEKKFHSQKMGVLSNGAPASINYLSFKTENNKQKALLKPYSKKIKNDTFIVNTSDSDIESIKTSSNDCQYYCTSKFSPSMAAMFENQQKIRSPFRVQLKHNMDDVWIARSLLSDKDQFADGSYAFVTHLPKIALELNYQFSSIVAWPINNDEHNNTCHFGLAQYEQKVAYAGEVKFSKGKLLFWNNASGTYKPDSAHINQSGFPEKNFTYPNFSY